MSSSHALPRVLLIGTGGTIGYAGTHPLDFVDYHEHGRPLSLDELVSTVPGVSQVAHLEIDPLLAEGVGGQYIGPAEWRLLLRRIHRALTDGPDLAGIVLTHGTAVLEETAYFLGLTVRSSSPIVLTGAVRPAGVAGADGALNLLSALRVAGSSKARGAGVLVVMNGEIHAARDVVKLGQHDFEAFWSPGPLGRVTADGLVRFYRMPSSPGPNAPDFHLDESVPLPRVDIVMAYSGVDSAAVEALVGAGAQGLVVTGSIVSAELKAALRRARDSGTAIAFSRGLSRAPVPAGVTLRREGYLSADNLQPKKARILLMLGLTRTSDVEQLQDMFDTL